MIEKESTLININAQKTFTFNIHGMHCKACVFMTESELEDVAYVTKAKTNLGANTIEVSGYFEEKPINKIAEDLNVTLKPHGYSLSAEKNPEDEIYKTRAGVKVNSENKNHSKWYDFNFAVPIALAFAILFLLLQKAGLVNLVNASKVTYSTAFFVGIIASLSTCMAVVGGLVLSMSATFAKEGDKIKPQILFHLGRIVSFFILGGVIGALGSAFTLSTNASFVLSLIIGIIMLILGINLLDVFPWAKKFQPAMPKFLSKHALAVSKFNHTLTPLLVGVATFFLPCGFTQSMQIYTLSTGSFFAGGLTMLSFALGTLPVLAIVSFSLFSIQSSKKAGVFFKSAGLIVIMFALFNLINSFVVIGVISPVFNF